MISYIGFVLILVMALIYFLPTILAFTRDHNRKWLIFPLNMLLGWTFIGWIILLIWACKTDTVMAGN